ncbi:MAG: TolC family protein, partial [Acidobacteriota bacterium]|nr:TolC family protein [Acidobacteriota bacterium]
MSFFRAPSRPVALLLTAVFFVWPAQARAADGPVPEYAPVPAEWTPPALTFPGGQITLLDAVRLTLENDPNLRLQEQSLRSQRGAFLTERGAFDSTISGSASYMFTQQALRLTQISREKKTREDFDKAFAAAQNDTAVANANLAEVNRIAANPDTYETASSDPGVLQFQFRVLQLNQLIANETDPAKKAVLVTQRSQALQAGIASFAAAVTGKQAAEQTAKEDRAKLGDVPKITQESKVDLNLSMSFPFRDGVTAGLFATGSYNANGYKGKAKQTELGGLGSEDVYNAEVGFSLNIALLRGRGTDATGAFEKAAGIDYEASALVLRQTASSSVANTIVAYWNLVAAQEFLEIARTAAGRGNKRLEVTDALIAGDELPRAERARSLASQATDAAQVASGERAVSEARVTLAKAMGLAVLESSNAPLAADSFPPAPDASTLSALAPSPFINMALQRRWDRQASEKLKESGGVLTTAARTALRPRLDFAGRISVNTIAETSLAQTAKAWTGPGWQASLRFEKPVGNNAAKGRLLQSEADLAQRTINASDLDRNIRANIVSLVASVKTTGEQVALLDEAVRFYGQTIDSESERYRGGQTS